MEFTSPEDDLWTGIIELHFGRLLKGLHDEDVEVVSDFLLHFGDRWLGFGGLSMTRDGYTPPNAPEADVALLYHDRLLCLAEALGVVAFENPEQSPDWGHNTSLDSNTLVHLIEDAIGISISTVGIVPVEGLATDRGPVHYRHINGLYAALRLRGLASSDKVCEYGGGIGLAAYYARLLGVDSYTLYDLPLTNVFSGHFLAGALGPDAVTLHGEEPTEVGVRIRPYWTCADARTDEFGVALNQDGFPEMDPSLVRTYLREIQRSTQGWFLSINQEARAAMGLRRQNSVAAMTEAEGGFDLVSRSRYWIREGYVEELFDLRRSRRTASCTANIQGSSQSTV